LFVGLVGAHWYVMGAAMTGEFPSMSGRVMRGLPKSFLGRALFTWFNPGPGTGYLFALCGVLAGLATLGVGLACGSFLAERLPEGVRLLFEMHWVRMGDRLPWFALVMPLYITVYLGIGLLVMRVLGRWVHLGIVGSIFLQVILVLAGCLGPLILELLFSGPGRYSPLHVTNPFWTMAEIFDGRQVGSVVSGAVFVLLCPAAAIVFALNLPGVIHEIRRVRVVKPERVAREDAELAPPRPQPPPRRTSPWDE
jgi:hypothetical protein